MQQTTHAPPSAISWFYIPAADFERAVRFYENIMETKLHVHPFGSDSIGVFSHDTDTGVGGCVTSGGTPSPAGVLIYLNVDQRLDRTLERVAPAGGRIVLAKFTLPEGQGDVAEIVDTEGNRIGLHAKA